MTADDAWVRAERSHEREMAEIASRERANRRKQTTERIQAVAIGLAVVGVVAVLCLLVWRCVVTVTENNTRRDIACNESGGTRVQIGTGPVACLHLTEEPR